MKRITLVRDAVGERCYPPPAYPLSLGSDEADIPLSGGPRMLAYFGTEQGHPFVQPADESTVVWHNHQQLQGSAWLKSGDQLQIGRDLVFWQVQGDQIVVSVDQAGTSPAVLAPPSEPPAEPVAPRAETMAARRPRRSLRWLLFGLFALLLAGAAFVMLATPVSLQLEPAPDRLSLRGFPPSLSVGDAFLALPGEYTLTATKAGYRPLQQHLRVDYDRPLRLQLELQKLPGLVDIDSSPRGALISIDGEPVGQTPLRELEVEPGVRQIRLEAPRHLPRELQLAVEGMRHRQQLTAELQPDWALVTLDSRPVGAEIRYQGRSLGRTPVSLELTAGEYQFEMAAPAHKPYQLRLQVRAGEPLQPPPVRLEPADGRLVLSTDPSQVTVSVDGRFAGITPLELDLAPDIGHLLRLTLAGHRPAELEVRLKPEEVRHREVRLQPEYGVVFIDSSPADASLLIDGRPGGPATARLELSVRPHSIEVRKPGYQPFRTTVLPSSSASRSLQVVLQPAGAVASTGDAKQNAADLLLIESAGQVTLGASRREAGRRANEHLREVELARAFYLGRREVTNAEFRRFRPGHDSGSVNGISLNGDRQPVVKVDWNDAARYLNWLSARQGLPAAYIEADGKMRLKQPATTGFRLPSEAEWAYAARFAGRRVATRFYWPGGEFPPPDRQGNYGDTSARALVPRVIEDYQDGFPVSAPVGSFKANPLGMFDLDGNVAEWVHDFYTIYPAAADAVAVDPLGPAQGRHHVVRGASWRDGGLSQLRSSYRDYSERPRDDLGFRVARYAR